MTIESELRALKNPDGLLVVEDIYRWVQAHPESKLHGALEWDDARAGYEWRLTQIRRLIHIHVTYEDGGPQFISLSVDRHRPGGGYRDLQDLRTDRSLWDIALADALNELARLQKKYERLQALTPIWAAAEEVRRGRRRGRSRGRGGDDRRASA